MQGGRGTTANFSHISVDRMLLMKENYYIAELCVCLFVVMGGERERATFPCL